MKPITGAERDALILEIIERIENDTQVIGAPERTEVWERGWADALAKFRANPCEESLIPAFIHKDRPVRYRGGLYHPDDKNNELIHCRRMQELISEKLFRCQHVAEFGSGTGWNLIELYKRGWQHLAALDFAGSSKDLIGSVNDKLGCSISPHKFDMLNPWDGVAMARESSGFFTFGAVEQLADKWDDFFQYLLAAHPQIVVHIEPIIELYDPRNLLDALAIRFHRKRGYAEGWLPWLQSDPRVEVIDIRRSYFGSLMHEGYSMVVWKPK